MEHTFENEYMGVRLKPFDLACSEKYRILRNRPGIRKWFAFKGKITCGQQAKWYAEYLENPNDVMFSAFDSLGNFIGGNSVYHIDFDRGIAEYGRLGIDTKFSGNGYGCKATFAAAMVAKKDLGLNRLILEVYQDNIPAIKAYSVVGFEKSGVFADAEGLRMVKMELDLSKLRG